MFGFFFFFLAYRSLNYYPDLSNKNNAKSCFSDVFLGI